MRGWVQLPVMYFIKECYDQMLRRICDIWVVGMQGYCYIIPCSNLCGKIRPSPSSSFLSDAEPLTQKLHSPVILAMIPVTTFLTVKLLLGFPSPVLPACHNIFFVHSGPTKTTLQKAICYHHAKKISHLLPCSLASRPAKPNLHLPPPPESGSVYPMLCLSPA